nr:1,4-dihydroxy-2-naphthoate polyprenyltransferase [Compostimonas suwonensis]
MRRRGAPGKTPAKAVKPASAADWISGARVRTLTLAVGPVVVGSSAAYLLDGFDLALAILCLVVALALQIGVNYSNDYSDGVRGTDDHRVGPARLTGSGAARPRTVLSVAIAFFALAAVAGLAIVLISGYYWLLVVGAVAIAAAWFYTGGKRPYGYYGFGELFVFVFFGIVATAGTTFVQAGTVNLEGWLGGVAGGLLACAILMVNNLRDIDTDRAAGKRTLAVLIGRTASRVVFCILMLLPYVIAAFLALFYPPVYAVFFALLLSLPACVIAITAKTPKELILALKLASFTALAYSVLLAFGLVVPYSAI